MIRIAVLAACAPFLSAHADEGASFQQNLLDTIHFRTARGDFLARYDLMPDIDYTSHSYKYGAEVSSATRTWFPSTFNAAYSIADFVELTATEGFLFHSFRSQANDATGAETGTVAHGWNDPTVGTNIRYAGELTGPFFGDAFLNFSPTTGHHLLASSTQDTNDLRGSSLLEVGTQLTGVEDLYEWLIAAQANYNFSDNSDATNTANSFTTDSYLRLIFELAARYHMSETFYLQISVYFYPPYSDHKTFFNQTAYTEDDSYSFYVQPLVTLGALLSRSVLLSLSGTFIATTENYTTTKSAATTPYFITTNEAQIDLGLSVLF